MSFAFKTVILFASYTVMYLLTEISLYGRFAAIFGSGTVSALYSGAMFMTGCGYLSFPCLSRFITDERKKQTAICIAAAIFFASALLSALSSSPEVVVLGAFASMASGGCLGGAALYAGAMNLSGGAPVEGRVIGIATAAATLIQYPIQNYTASPYIRLAAVALCLLFFLKTLLPLPLATTENRFLHRPARGKEASGLATAVIMALFLSFYYGIGDGILMKLDAEGRLSVVTWPRLLYVVSILLAGWIADVKNGRYLTLITVVMVALLTIYPMSLSSGGSCRLFHIIFWFFSGFYVIYLSVTFMRLSVKSTFPELWAGMGRSVKQFVNCISVIPTAILLETSGTRWVMYCNAAIVLAMTAFVFHAERVGRKVARDETEYVSSQETGESGQDAPKESSEEKLNNFAERYLLNSRETHIVGKMVSGDETVKKIAESLGISERTCERNITSIYEKTGAKSRAALLILFLGKSNDIAN